ncbi:MAG: imidazole glycerol phosphate synthase subunit HisF [Eubacteriales bacterium]|jgi:cyclase
MLGKRIIPCLDVTDGRVVKGVHFVDLKDVGDPIEIARYYEKQGADEIVFLDITATSDGRATMVDLISRCASQVFMPLTVGGGIRTVEDFRQILRAGADKVSINSSAVKNPQLISQAAEIFGSQCVVVAVDVRRHPENHKSGYNVVIAGGRIDTGLDALEWVQQAWKLGAGEILLTSMEADGTKAGYDLGITKAVCQAVDIPVIASGGAGTLEHFPQVFEETGCDAALAASLFHFKELEVSQVKETLRQRGIPVRR